MRIEVICTGDEVLTGKTINTNFAMISQKLEDVGLAVRWETTVGDDRDELLLAFQLAGQRAHAVVVNGGLGPTVDDLSQEVAARAAGVDLVRHEGWVARMEEYFRARGRIMPSTNHKQAMLPAGAELIDNPIGTACGFAMTIGRARFMFTPGVPREVRRMIDEQLIPRLLEMYGTRSTIYLKRFHSFGLGESRVDEMLAGVEALAPEGSVRLGFRAHYPQLETKLAVRGRDMEEVRRQLGPVEAEVRRRLGNFLLAEDDQTLERNVLGALLADGASVAIVETFTGGQIAARLAPLPDAGKAFRRAVVGLDREALARTLGAADAGAVSLAAAARADTGASHGLAVLVDVDEGQDRVEFGGTVDLAIVTAAAVATRRSRLQGGREWLRLGAIEMALDCLRRQLAGLPVDERIDFEKSV
ncbi:MAG: CinA family nicotinamide mononucleotide deamidase-related protein [Burkholderiales bacterium]|nr:CinA family nicotinamide mononucleotide deamidase-related protein [Burkholderiales bacterium]